MGLDPARKLPQEPPPADAPSEPKEASSKQAAAKPRPHSGGVWVVYFSLAALPLFGLGQRFLPADNADRRRYAFLLLCIYVTSALGLLLTTSFLGLRRYLRGRRLQMPAAMAGAWVTIGCLLIAAILGFAILLPRPNAEYAVSEAPWKMTSPTRNASRHAVGKEGTNDPNQDARGGEDRQRPDAKAPKGEGGQRKSDGRDTSRSGPTREGKSSEAKNGSDESKGGQQQGKNGPADQKGSPSDAKGGDSADRKGSQNQAQGDPKQSQDSSKGSASDRKARQDRETGSKDDARSRSGSAADRSQAASPPPPKPTTSFPSWNLPLSGLLKWIFYLALILAVAYAAWKSRAALADALRDLLESLRRLWASLFGPKQGPKKTGPSQESTEAKPAPRPFADYADPFAAGWAEQWPPDELVRYTFAALEAWGREHGCPRGPEQTAYEFAERLGDRSKPLGRHCRKMAALYSRAAYAPGTLPPSSVAPLREFWQQLTSA